MSSISKHNRTISEDIGRIPLSIACAVYSKYSMVSRSRELHKNVVPELPSTKKGFPEVQLGLAALPTELLTKSKVKVMTLFSPESLSVALRLPIIIDSAPSETEKHSPGCRSTGAWSFTSVRLI